jgi:hypothetical protein
LSIKFSKTNRLFADYISVLSATRKMLEDPQRRNEVRFDRLARIVLGGQKVFDNCMDAVDADKAVAVAEVEARVKELQEKEKEVNESVKAIQGSAKLDNIKAMLVTLTNKVDSLTVCGSRPVMSKQRQ